MLNLQKWKITDLNPGAYLKPDYCLQSKNTAVIHSFNPSNEKLLGSVQSCSYDDLQKLITSAEDAFSFWRNMPAPTRGELVRQIGDALRKQKNDLAQLITLEMGKPINESLGEVQEMIDMADFAVGQSRMLYGNTMQSERPSHRLYEQWHPLGIVGVITAFNFPVAVWSWNAFIAAICGNVVIWKPSSKVPLCAIAVQYICNSVLKENNYPGIFSLFISHDENVNESFVKDERISLISFTGSTKTGKKINEWVASRLGRCLLELGGNNAVIVDETANEKLALTATLFGAVGTSGQRCTTTRRLLLHENIAESFISKLVSAYQEIKIGDPCDPRHHVGPLLDRSAVENYLHAIVEIKKQGGQILFGGKKLGGPGFYVEPTLVKAEPHWDIVQRETFAPILYVMEYADLLEAVSVQNKTEYGLSSSLFTQNLQHAEYFLSARGSDCGIANINVGTSGAEIGGAFGGEKKTGGGREAGSDAWKAYMRRQTCTINWGNALPLSQGIRFEL